MDDAIIHGTVLVVDDDSKVILFINGVFMPRGYQVLTASTGEEALKVIEGLNQTIDLVLLDLRMPGLDGVEVLKIIKKKHPDIPVGILTAYDERKEECIRDGADFFMAKPYSLRELYSQVENLVAKRGKPREDVPVIMPGHVPVAKILVVDDENEICDLLKEHLEEGPEISLGEYRVEVAYNGKEGIQKAREFEPDLMIVDIKMPHLRGDKMIDILESEGPQPKDYVILTAIDSEEEKHKTESSGYSYVTKPFDVDKLSDLLRRLCFKHGLTRKL